MLIKATKCPKCWGRLYYETIGSYGDVFLLGVKSPGTIGKKVCREHYEHEDDMVYCLSCGTNYEFKVDNDVVYIDPDSGRSDHDA